MSYADDEPVTFRGLLVRKTGKAVLLDIADDVHTDTELVWFPLSQTEEIGNGMWTCPRWLAREKGVEGDGDTG